MSNRNGNNGKFDSSKKPRGQSLNQELGKKPRSKKSIVNTYDDVPRRQQPRREVVAQPLTNKRLGEFTIERISHDGRGVATLDGKTLFIEGALAGELVTARLVQDHPRFIDARVDQVRVSSAERIVPECIHYGDCGGCQWQHGQPQLQLVSKQHALLDQLQRWGGIRPRRQLPPVTSVYQGYRTRARLGVWYEVNGDVILGFRQRYSNALVQVNLCTVLDQRLVTLLSPLRQWLLQLRSPKAVTHIELIATDSALAMVLRHTKKLAEFDLIGLESLAAEHDCAIWLEPNAGGLTDLQARPCDPRLTYQVLSLELAFHPQDFTQINTQVNQQMVAQALTLLALRPDDRVLDLFCGIGNFTLPLALNCAEVIGVEAVEAMVQRGRENAARLHITNVKFVAGDLARMTPMQLESICNNISVILLDPPREGAKDILTNLLPLITRKQLLVKRIVYVSCNPATLARDAKLLVEAGYELDAVGVLDMFPQTSHVESMALFSFK